MQRKDVPVMRRGDLTDEQLEKMCKLLSVSGKGRPFDNLRRTVDGILWVMRTGSPWRDLPTEYGNWNAVYKCFSKWEKAGIYEAAFKELCQEADMQDVSMDSSCCKAHQHSAGAKKGGMMPPLMNILG